MPHPNLSEAQIRELASWVATYISEQRTSFQGRAAPIEPGHKAALEPFFPATLLGEVRVVRGRASEPSFYRQLQGLGITNAPPFSEMAGITFQDVVVHAEPLTRRLLFHELVHAVQYRHLGLPGFAEYYVRGFLSGGSYEQIPLEKQAYELEARFADDPAEQFSVDADVQRRLKLRQL
jgi:hypothetical protein